jgi:hypothetical protein
VRLEDLKAAGERLHGIGHDTTVAAPHPKTRLFRHAP